jgi:predicted metal-dependent hydrolase
MTPADANRAFRLVPDRSFPPYAFVPGRHPHPQSDPAGHSFGVRSRDPVAALDPRYWQASEEYLYGFDLFNAGFYWEAHEAWECLWHAAGRRGTTADFLKALIKLAAAGVKHRQGMPAGVKTHAGRAAELLHGIARSLPGEQGCWLGFPIEELIELAEAVAREGWPIPPPVLRPSGERP